MSTAETSLLDVGRAVALARQALPRFLGSTPVGIRVEEVVPSDVDGWNITLSYLEPTPELPDPVFAGFPNPLRKAPPPERVLRVIEVGKDGARAMRRRERGT